MSGPLVIGLDVGTSAVKAACYGPGGRRGHVVERPVTTVTDGEGTATQDPWGTVAAALDALGACARSVDRSVDAVALSAGMHGLVGLDGADRPVTPVWTWADTRSYEVVAGWRNDGRGGWIHARTGVPNHPMTPVSKLGWLGAHRPDTVAAVRRWVDLKALVVGALCGRFLTDASSASGWGLMDLHRRVWDPEVAGLVGVDPSRLPRIGATTDRLGLARDAADRTGLAVGTPVVLGAADGPLGNLGVGALAPGSAALSVGTSGAVRTTVTRVPDALPEDLFCYVLDGQRWVVGAAVSNAGSVLSWLAQALFEDPELDPARVLGVANSSPPGANGVVMVPYLFGERAPLWDVTVAGAYLGLRRNHTRADLVRAALEGVAAGLAVMVDRVDSVGAITEVRATGGALRDPLWRRIVAGAIRPPVRVVDTVDGSARGAAALGFVALDAAPDLEAALGVLGAGGSPEPVEVDTQLRAAAAGTRDAIRTHASALTRVGAAFG